MKILLVDDHNLFAEGLRTLLSDFEQDPEVIVCGSCEQALRTEQPESINLILLDYYLAGVSGVAALKILRENFTNSQIAVVSAEDDPAVIREIIDTGAAGFIPKTSTFAVLSAALKLVLSGGTYLPPRALADQADTIAYKAVSKNKTENGKGLDCLSKRQREVLLQVVQGKPNKVIAKNLEISEHTVKAHISASFRLLGVRNRTEAVYAAAKLQGQTFGEELPVGGG